LINYCKKGPKKKESIAVLNPLDEPAGVLWVVGREREWWLIRLQFTGYRTTISDVRLGSGNGAVVNDNLTHLIAREPEASLTGLCTGAFDHLCCHEEGEETSEDESSGESGLSVSAIDGKVGGEGAKLEGATTADLLPLLVAGDGSIL
jgi:hypothetical protein